jgi:nitroreductase
MDNPTIDAIFHRRSIRKYTDQPVEPEKLDLLLQAGMAAPSAMNCKPWEFIVVTDPEKLAQFRKRLIFGDRNAPAAIVVCGNPGLSINPAARLFWLQDCSAATENIHIDRDSSGRNICQDGASDHGFAQKGDAIMYCLCGLPVGE